MINILTGVRWYFTVVLICISLMISYIEHFSYVYWWSVFPLWRSIILPIFKLDVCLLGIELYKFLTNLYCTYNINTPIFILYMQYIIYITSAQHLPIWFLESKRWALNVLTLYNSLIFLQDWTQQGRVTGNRGDGQVIWQVRGASCCVRWGRMVSSPKVNHYLSFCQDLLQKWSTPKVPAGCN